MLGYSAIHLPMTRCVRFVRNHEIDGSEGLIVEAALKEGVKFVYWNYLEDRSESATIADPLGRALELEHGPYGKFPWVPFLDD
jgi:hypothetical protein